MTLDDFQTREASFRREGWLRVTLPRASGVVEFLRKQLQALAHAVAKPRPWHYAELHNPWSRTAAVYDSWGFLDLASSPAILDAVSAALGPDIILYDSQWMPDRWDPSGAGHEWITDLHRVPVEPRAGVTALVAIADCKEQGWRFDCVPGSHQDPARSAVLEISLRAGELLLCDARLRYRWVGASPQTGPLGYAVRYFPAGSRYLREPHSPVHLELTERYPLLNYARMPLWLVRGADRADNDFVTGFRQRAGRWVAGARGLKA
jgi:hypothetical protein